MLSAVLFFYARNTIKIDKYCVCWPPRREFRLWRISFGLPLASELDALCTEGANPSRLRRQVRSVQVTKTSAAGILPAANMPTLAAGEQAPRRSRLACEPDSASLRLRSRFDCEDGIKARSTARADLAFMAPATGIEPVTTP